jgi:hypothetical protein
MKKLQLQNLSHIVCFLIIFLTLYKQGVWSSNFTLKNLCTMGRTNQKVYLKTKKQIMHNFKLFTSLTYLSI